MVDKHHLDFCMSFPSNSVKLDEENTARLNELADCQARNAATKTRCETFAKEAMVDVEEFKRLQCTGGAEIITGDLARQEAMCAETPNEKFFASAAEARKLTLDACKAKLAANGGAGAPALPPGAPAPGPAPVPPPAPAGPLPRRRKVRHRRLAPLFR